MFVTSDKQKDYTTILDKGNHHLFPPLTNKNHIMYVGLTNVNNKMGIFQNYKILNLGNFLA